MVNLNRHAGLVPASTVQQAPRSMGLRHGGPRDKPGVTRVEMGQTQIQAEYFRRHGYANAAYAIALPWRGED